MDHEPSSIMGVRAGLHSMPSIFTRTWPESVAEGWLGSGSEVSLMVEWLANSSSTSLVKKLRA